MASPDVVIIGAPRSGTNMLRDLLTDLPAFTTWPCDEINPIWRHGNRDHPTDELPVEAATPAVRHFIRGRFERVRAGADVRVVEKTCANSLRVEFVREVLPDAQIVLITRDGLDAAPSAVQRWSAPLDLGYTVAKARFVPKSDLPYYAQRFLTARLARRGPVASAASWWGPRFEGGAQLLQDRPLDEVALAQWSRCVRRSQEGLTGLGPDRLHHVVYESFVREPRREIHRLADFLGVEVIDPDRFVQSVSSSSVGKGRESLTPARRAHLASMAARELEMLGYAST